MRALWEVRFKLDLEEWLGLPRRMWETDFLDLGGSWSGTGGRRMRLSGPHGQGVPRGQNGEGTRLFARRRGLNRSKTRECQDFLPLSRGALKHFPAGSDMIPPSRGETWSRGLHDHYLPQRGFMKSLFPSCRFGAPCPPKSSVPSALCSAWQSQALVREWRTEKRQFGQFCIVCAAEGMDVGAE